MLSIHVTRGTGSSSGIHRPLGTRSPTWTPTASTLPLVGVSIPPTSSATWTCRIPSTHHREESPAQPRDDIVQSRHGAALVSKVLHTERHVMMLAMTQPRACSHGNAAGVPI